MGKSCGVCSPGASGVRVAAGDAVERLQQENPELTQLEEKKNPSWCGSDFGGSLHVQFWCVPVAAKPQVSSFFMNSCPKVGCRLLHEF